MTGFLRQLKTDVNYRKLPACVSCQHRTFQGLWCQLHHMNIKLSYTCDQQVPCTATPRPKELENETQKNEA